MKNPIIISEKDRDNVINYYLELYNYYLFLEENPDRVELFKNRIFQDSIDLMTNNGLIDFFNMIPQEYILEILDLFDFGIVPFQNGDKIHVVSMILGVNIFDLDFPGKRMKNIIQHKDLLNEIFSGLIQFHGNGNPLIEIEYLYREQQNTLWYLG